MQLKLNASVDKHRRVYILLNILANILVLYLRGFQSLGSDAFSPLKLDHAVQSEIMCVCSTCGELSSRFTGMLMRSGIKDLANVSDPS